MSKANRCEGERRKFRGNCYGTFKCGRKATGYVRTNVGVSRTHYVCDDPECFQAVTGGYPATFTPLKKE